MEAIDADNLSWDDVVRTSERAASMGGSQIFLEPGEQMTVKEMMKGIAIASGNDASVAMAEHLAGSEKEFVIQMNEKAKELGLKNTNFVNSNGLPAENHYSSAYDLAEIGKELLHHEKITEFTSLYEDYLREDTDDPFWLVNTNKLVKHIEGIDGLKTGWTSGAGYNLTATMSKDNMRLISVVMGEASPSQRSYDTVKLLNYGFSQFEIVEYKSKNYQVGEYSNMLLTPTKIKIVTNEPVYFVVKKGQELKGIDEQINFTIKEGKIKTGEKIGDLTLIKNGKVVYTVPLTVEEDVNKASFFELFGRMIKSMYFK